MRNCVPRLGRPLASESASPQQRMPWSDCKQRKKRGYAVSALVGQSSINASSIDQTPCLHYVLIDQTASTRTISLIPASAKHRDRPDQSKVAFVQPSLTGLKRRQVMYQRQRVWRACQACRRKKVKCDGGQPCQSCSRNRAECVYADLGGSARHYDDR